MIGKQKRIKECQQIATAIKPTKMAIPSSVPNTYLITPIIRPQIADARVSVKPGKARQLNYFGQIAVDDAHHVITGACSDFADKRQSMFRTNCRTYRRKLKENGIELEELLADGGYSSGEALAYLHEKNINAYIPNFGQYKSEREGFTFNKEENYYQCTKPEGNQAKLLFKGEKGI